jgi:hypothetical protein
MLAVTDVADLEFDEVAVSQLAIDAQVEQGELSDAAQGTPTYAERG